MAPERPSSLVILDLRSPGAADGGTVYHWDPVDATRDLIVLWEAARDTAAQSARRGTATRISLPHASALVLYGLYIALATMPAAETPRLGR